MLSSSRGVPAHRFLVFAQNHDQVGNRRLGERLTQLVSFEALKLAAGVTILSPYLPLLFMGEEYGEVAPFQYFISHLDQALIEAVRRGRREEFAAFGWQTEPPDPQSEEIFRRSKLNHDLKQKEGHRVLWEFYRELLRIRREKAPFTDLNLIDREVHQYDKEKVPWVHYPGEAQETALSLNFNDQPASLAFPCPPGRWDRILDSAEERWRGPGSRVPRYSKGMGRFL